MDAAAEYFDIYMIPNYLVFGSAETALSKAALDKDHGTLHATSRWALAAAMNVAVPAYHMADVMFDEPTSWPAWLPCDAKLERFRQMIEDKYCRNLRSEFAIADLTLLGAVVDSYKHATLRRKQPRPVTSRSATIITATGYGELGYGEGNWGGVDQVIVRINDGSSRALSAVLQNVIDMWRLALNRQLEPFGR